MITMKSNTLTLISGLIAALPMTGAGSPAKGAHTADMTQPIYSSFPIPSSPSATLVASVSDAAPVAGDLSQCFENPPDSVKPSCYWWWFNSLVDKEDDLCQAII